MYKSIKELVITETKKINGEFPKKSYLNNLVKEHFPKSKWKDTHYSWYKSQIKRGLITIGNERTNSSSEFESSIDYEFSLSLEKDLQSYLSSNLNEIEEGLELLDNGIEYKTSAGYIDLLAKDKNDNIVVIELKAGKGKDSVIGQVLGYIGAISEEYTNNKIRGIVVALDFENRLYYAKKSLPNLKLIKYNLNFTFTETE